MKKRDYNEGFTIVEVALVLAIAGLIFLMVFVALPAIQRTQRDAERRDDLGALLTAIQKYQNNNRGALPTTSATAKSVTWDTTWTSTNKPDDGTWENLYYGFLGEEFTDPHGENYTLVVKMCGATAGQKCDGNINNLEEVSFNDNGFKIYVAVGASCDGSNAIGSNNPRKAVAVYKMEGPGVYCAGAQ